MKVSLYIIFTIVTLALGAFTGCSSPQDKGTPVPEAATADPQDPPPPECLPGCSLAGNGKCETVANSMDWNSTSTETIPCEPRCCEEGVDEVETAGPDTDGDGVLDENDNCPEDPEDMDGFEDDDGCPDADNDEDGIADADDLCPLEAEDVDGFQDQDGCPDP